MNPRRTVHTADTVGSAETAETPQSTLRPRRRLRAWHLITAGVAATALLTACGSGSDPLADDDASASGSAEASGEASADPEAIAIGSQAYYSNEIIAELYAQALEANGFSVDRQYQIGQREVYLPELESGEIDVIPDYTGNLLQYYDEDAAAEAGSADEVFAALDDALPEDLRVLQYAEATDQDSYTVTAETAEEHNLSAIGDLAQLDQPVSIAANSEFESRPYGPAGAEEVYGVQLELTPVEDSGGPLTVSALTDGTVQVADIYTASPAIAENNLVVLEDPESLILPQNVVPVTGSDLDTDAAAIIEDVQRRLTVEDLIELNTQSVNEQASSADLASQWLEDQGIS
ncbi:ABC transporter substrate-binding protein [Citricoccus muralis]|uniref:ABC transporter substrate-binding protein n=1 Tax=Citricoccus muralis TaxID=169134 RepID=A0ABY8H9L6_9MICC|nr:ABC transporter substrate-binding protein [Citricoccus muralis]WFP17307.1 ABC transporter substrate-binding protein [Citricoccus muralis]